MRDELTGNKWCLEKETLRQFITVVFKSSPEICKITEREGKQYISLPLQSATSSEVYYELVLAEDNVCVMMWSKEEEEYEVVCVYSEGVIVRWGMWAVELMSTLPKLIINVLRSEADGMATLLHDQRGNADEKFSRAEMLLVANNAAFSEEMIEKIYSEDRSCIPLYLL